MRRYKDKSGAVYQIIPHGVYPFKRFEFWVGRGGVLHPLPLEPVEGDREKAEKKLAKYAAKHNLRKVLTTYERTRI